MKQRFLLLVLLLAAVCGAHASVVWKVWNTDYRVDTTFHARIGPGTTQTSLLLTGPDTTLTVFYLTVDLTNPYVDIRTVCATDHLAGAQTVTKMAQSHSVDGEKLYFAGVNAGFFAMSGEANDGKTSIVGRPHHASVADREIYRTSTSNICRHFGITADKVPYLSNKPVNFAGTIASATDSYEISGVNIDPINSKIILYTDKMPGQVTQATGTKFPSYYEIALMPQAGEKLVPGVPCKMTVKGSCQVGTNMKIPTGGFVICGKGSARPFIEGLKDGDEVVVTLPMSFDGEEVMVEHMTTGNPKILGNGAPLNTESERADAVEWHPRTAIGYTKDKKTLIMLVCDGRTSVSRGVRTRELADLMIYAGADEAMNLDGGGSSTLYTSMLGVRNYPSSNGVQRNVGDGVFVVSTAPKSALVSGIDFATPPHTIAKGEEYKPVVYGYNAYDLLVNTSISSYTITCDEWIGYVKSDGKTFVADGIGVGKIYASTPAGYTCEMTVAVKEDIEDITFRLDSVLSDCHYEYPVEVSMKKGNGEIVSLSAAALSWNSTNSQVAVVENGLLKGLKSGRAELYGSISGVSDTLKVKVQEPSSHVLNINSGAADWLKASFTTTAGFKNTSVTNSVESGLQISFRYNSTSANTIALSGEVPMYSIPDTLRIHINPGAAQLKAMSCTLKLPTNKVVSVDLPVPALNKENVVDVPIVKTLGSAFDIANYPITLTGISMSMAINTVGETYQIDIPAVELVYNYYNENADGITVVKGEALKFTVADHTVILDKPAESVALYNAAGVLLASAKNSDRITAPGIGLYVIRVETGSGLVSQKILINR